MKKTVLFYYLFVCMAIFYACTNDISENILPSPPDSQSQQENSTGVIIISDDDGKCDDCCMFSADTWCSTCREC